MKGDEVLTQVENAQNRLFLGLSASYYYDKLSWLSASLDGYYGWSKYTALSPLLPERTDGTEWGVNGFLSFNFNESRTWTGYVSGDYTGRTKTAVAIVKPAEGKTNEVKAALEAYVASEQQSMEHYLEDQYLVAKAATVTVAPTGEVVLVCAEDHDTILANIEKALAA